MSVRPRPDDRSRRRASAVKKGGGAGRTSAAPSAQGALAPDLRARPTPPKPTTKRASESEGRRQADGTSPGSLIEAERLGLIAGIETVLEVFLYCR